MDVVQSQLTEIIETLIVLKLKGFLALFDCQVLFQVSAVYFLTAVYSIEKVLFMNFLNTTKIVHMSFILNMEKFLGVKMYI